MTFDIHRDADPISGGSTLGPIEGAATKARRSLRSRSGGLLTSTALVGVGFAIFAGEAAAQVPAGYAPAPAEVVSYVQLSNGSVLVQLANNQSLLVTSNNYVIDSAGVLYLSPSVGGNIGGGAGAAMAGAPAPLLGGLPPASVQAPPSSTGVLFDDTAVAANSGGMVSAVTGGPGLFGLGTLGTIAAVGLGTGALLLGVNAVRARLEENSGSNSAAGLTVVDDAIVRGETNGSISYTIADADGLDRSALQVAVENAVGGASTVASIFPGGAEVTVTGIDDNLVDGTEDTYATLSVNVTGGVAEGLNLGVFPGPAVSFKDAAGNDELVNFSLNISESDTDTDGGSDALELDQADGSTHEIAQGGSKLFKATDPDGDTISYEISNNPSGIGIDSNTGLVVVASSVATGSYTITVKASSTGADGSVETDTETYNITVTEGSGGSSSVGNTVNADFDSASAGFNTLTGVNTTDGDTADSGDNEFEVVAASHLANSFVLDGLAGDDTVYFSEAGATYHLDPIDENAFEDVSGFETLSLLADVDLEINGGVLDSEDTGDIEHIQGSGDNVITLVNADADMGLDVSVTNVASIDLNGYDLTLDHSDLSQIDSIIGENLSMLVFSGQFSYDFADGLITTDGVSRIGLDGGNYSYVLTLDGVNDEDVREIYADAANEIEGDVMIDARENSNISLIDLAGDGSTTGGLDGDSNIFVTYDDELTILGGENDDDVDVILDSDIEDGEFSFDGGLDGEDSLNINLNGDEIDTLNFGRSINNVEYVDVDAPDGDGEAHLQFNGNSQAFSQIEVIDISDVRDDSTISLQGDLSDEDGFRAAAVNNVSISFDAATADASLSTLGDETAAFGIDASLGTAYVDELIDPIDAAEFIDNSNAGNTAAIARFELLIEGFVADDDLEIKMTSADDTVNLMLGETQLDLIIDDGADSAAFVAEVNGTTITDNAGNALTASDFGVGNNLAYAFLDDGGVTQNATIQSLLTGPAVTAASMADGDLMITGVRGVTDGDARGSQEVNIELGGGDDSVDLVLGSAQQENVTISFERASSDEFDTVTFTALEDLAGAPGTTAAEGVIFDFADDIQQIISSTATDANSVNEQAAASHQGLIVFGSAVGSTQQGFIYDADGDGVLSDGDTLVDLTAAVDTNNIASTANGVSFTSVLGDTWNFVLDDGNLADII